VRNLNLPKPCRAVLAGDFHAWTAAEAAAAERQAGHSPDVGLWPVGVLLLGLSALVAVEASASSPAKMRRSHLFPEESETRSKN
jgi:hypothetical protein